MAISNPGKISLTQAFYLALTVLVVYYPLSIYVNLPFRLWTTLEILIIPAFLNFAFYMMLILATDRIIDLAEKKMGPRFLLEVNFGTIALSIIIAGVATLLSQGLFRASFELWKFYQGPRPRFTPQAPGGLPPLVWVALGRTNNALTIVIAISIFYLILNRKANARMKDMELQAEQLKKENALAQYEALKNQVSPHFLFNSLSILSSLVHTDAHLSERFIDQLSKAYRYILEQKNNDSVSLKTELDFIRSYAFLLKIRFEEKFDVKIEISDTEAAKYQVAPLTLQLLIENAVKHNKMSAKDPLRVTIRKDEKNLIVENPVQSREANDPIIVSTGIGLNNIINRYRLLTAHPVEIIKLSRIFRVQIPLLS